MERQLTPEAEKAIDRVAKLLALAKNNDSEGEASSAMDAAMRILEAYNLDMALVERRSGDTSTRKREDQKTGGGLYKWQRVVWENVATLNFCRYASVKGLRAGSKYENRVIGSNVNVLSTTLMAEYLQTTIERMAATWVRDTYAPGTSRFIRHSIAYREGMADRIGQRLQSLRWDREDTAKRERDAMPRGDGTSLILVDVIEAERDANDDVLHGLEPGTHAKWRTDSKLRRAKADAEAKRLLAERDEAEAENPALKTAREKAEAAAKIKADKENEAWWRKNGHKYRTRERKSDQPRSVTYYDGQRAGETVGLDPQIEQGGRNQRRIG